MRDEGKEREEEKQNRKKEEGGKKELESLKLKIDGTERTYKELETSRLTLSDDTEMETHRGGREGRK